MLYRHRRDRPLHARRRCAGAGAQGRHRWRGRLLLPQRCLEHEHHHHAAGGAAGREHAARHAPLHPAHPAPLPDGRPLGTAATGGRLAADGTVSTARAARQRAVGAGRLHCGAAPHGAGRQSRVGEQGPRGGAGHGDQAHCLLAKLERHQAGSACVAKVPQLAAIHAAVERTLTV
eukprot:201436-Chlamydomonas_euryale.AAC.1